MKQTTLKIYQDMTTDEFIDLLQRLKGSKTVIKEIAVKARAKHSKNKHYFTIKTEDIQ